MKVRCISAEYSVGLVEGRVYEAKDYDSRCFTIEHEIKEGTVYTGYYLKEWFEVLEERVAL